MSDKMKAVFSIFTSVFLVLIFMGCVSAQYYDYADPWYGTEFYDYTSDYYETADSNQIIIEFDKDGSYYVYTPNNYYYNSMINEIYMCIHDQSLDADANAATLKSQVKEICQYWGIDNPDIVINSPYGEDSFIYIGIADGISMEPTIHDGEMLVLNKTRDFQVGDIVSAYYDVKHIDILKRVATIKGDEVYLVSDNVNGTIVKDGQVYKYEGIRTWVNMSDINGVLIDSYSNGNYNYGYNDDVIMV